MAIPTRPTLIRALWENAERRPDALAYRFLEAGDADGPAVEWSHQALGQAAARTASWLRSEGLVGERVLLLYAPGVDFAGAFLGCLLAGAVAVPAYPPDPTRISLSLGRLRAIAEDAQVRAILTTAPLAALLPMAAEEAPGLVALPCQATDVLPEDRALDAFPAPSADALAFLQYTSGSTGRPKGVMITHGHIVAQLATGARHTAGDAQSHVVNWLPQYHDLGLMTGFLMQPYLGCSATILSPVDFLKRPLRWVEAIARFGGTHAGGPDFGYALCAKKATPEFAATLDLSTWHTAFNAAEPVRAETIDLFNQAFAPSRFAPRAFMPGYGLAEATMGVTWAPHAREATRLAVDPEALAEHRIERSTQARPLTLFGHGPADPFEIAIVELEQRRVLEADRVGEIWVRGPSVGLGYWNRTEETAATFQAFTADGRGPYLRTGDLGALIDGELYITGRQSDLIILRGRNYYPHDFEWTLESASPEIRPGCSAAFSIEAEGEERLAVVCEAKVTPAGAEALVAAIRARIAQDHGVSAHVIAIVAPRSIPKTSSGKIQRRATKQALLDGTLELLGRWQRPCEAQPAQAAAAASPDQHALEQWILVHLRALVGGTIDRETPLHTLGLDSREAIGLVAELERHTGQTLSPTVVYDHPSAAALARHLAGSGSVRAEEPAGQADEPIAIIGLAGRFPGSGDVEELWAHLVAGDDLIQEVPADRFDLAAVYDPDPNQPGKLRTRFGGFLSAVDTFDAGFFGISPREAQAMDPQQRLLLEVAWTALEDAGLPARDLAGSDTAVAIGISSTEYGTLQFRELAAIDAYTGTGSALCIAANRLSYFLDLRGPSWSVDTACSSSLVAVHQACEALRRGEARLALAGGVSLILSPAVTINFSKAGAMAPDGRCKTFDAAADGYVRSEGVGVVVLKPLSQAVADGDRIRAIIRGSAVQQDGRTNGLMAPSPKAQASVIRAACARAQVAPAEVAYVEAHGTGTTLGDTIEAEALGAALRPEGGPTPLRVGSIKTNLGHLEAAAGIAGLIKLVLCLERGQLPASLHFQTPNPQIPFQSLGLQVQQRLEPWPSDQRYAGVSSFGFGGTIAHAILERAQPARVSVEAPEAPLILPLSARSESALAALVERWRRWLPTAPSWRDALHTASARREHHPHRRCYVAADPQGLLAALAADGQRSQAARPRRVVLVFPGQGGQWAGMGQALYQRALEYRRAFDACAEALAPHLERPLGSPGSLELDRIDRIQPAIFATQVALFRCLVARGLRPDAVLGHSLGEVAAAHVAGVLTLEDAARIIAVRSRHLLAVAGRGAMLYTELDHQEAEGRLNGHHARVSVAAVNGPRATVLAGAREELEPLEAQLEAEGVYVRWVKVDVASHSPEVDPILAPLAAELGTITARAPTIPLWSTVRGRFVEAGELEASYWLDNLRQPVLFAPGVEALSQSGHDVFLELSPHPTLTPGFEAWSGPVALPILRRDEDAAHSLAVALAELFTLGVEVDLSEAGHLTSVPAYPFARSRHWSPAVTRAQQAPALGSFAFGPGWSPADQPERRYWPSELSLETHPWLADHRVEGQVVLPGAHAVLLFWEAVRALPGGPFELQGLELERPIFVEAEQRLQLQVILQETDPQRWTAVLWARLGEGPWQAHARATVAAATPSLQALAPVAAPEAPGVDLSAHYQALEEAGLAYGPAFRRLGSLQRQGDRSWGQLDAGARLETTSLDAGLQAFAVLDDRGQLALPRRIARVRLGAPVPAVAVTAQRRGPLVGDLSFWDAAGQPVLQLEGFEVQPLSREGGTLYQITWQEAPLSPEARTRVVAILGDAPPLSALGDLLSAAGHRVLRSAWGSLAGLVDELQAEPESDWIISTGPTQPDGDWARQAIEDPAWEGALALLRAFAERPNPGRRLWLLTEGAHRVLDTEGSLRPAERPLLALGNVIQAEHPELVVRQVDLDPLARRESLLALGAELGGDSPEDRIAYRQGRRWVARLGVSTLDAQVPTPLAPGEAFGVKLPAAQTFEALRFHRQRPRAPGLGEVQLEVRAAGLNFSDVLKVLGAYPGRHADVLGAECAGVISAVGEGVTGWRVGDRVLAIAPGAFASHVTTHAALVAPLPKDRSFQDGATLPIAWLTASWGLERLAHLGRGERVLIHSGTGGVGRAAIAIAQGIGAEIHATAGTVEKRARLQALGVHAVYDARDPNFAEELREQLGPRGLDVVIGAPTGLARSASLAALGPGGRYVDLGKVSAGADRLPPNGSLLHVDVAEWVATDPEGAGAYLQTLLPRATVLPSELHPARNLASALQRMAAAEHQGKLVIELDPLGLEALPLHPQVRPEAAYLITGGLGGLGLSLAAWLVERGARQLYLVGRSAPSAAAEAQLEALRRQGTAVEVVAADVADRTAVQGLVGRLGDRLAGVFHLAGVLDDGPVLTQSPERFRAVWAPKMQGALHLHEACRGRQLDFFVLYSSAAGLLGSPGQSSYAAANAFLDGLAQARQAQGLPALSLAFGPFEQAGLVADEEHQARFRRLGLRAYSPVQGVAQLERALASGQAELFSLDADWARLGAGSPYFARPFFEALQTQSGDRAQGTWRRQLEGAAAAERPALLESLLVEQVAAVLRAPAATIDPSMPLQAMGIDSLMALELRNRLERATETRLNATVIWRHPTIARLGAHLAERLGLAAVPFAPELAPAPVLEEAEGQALLDLLSSLKS